MSSIPNSATDGSVAHGFPPVAGSNARVLILGSLPSQQSLRAEQYYAHPQNAFWQVMNELVAATGPYAVRCERLIECRIALWDVLASSVRPGSMDADIRLESATANDFHGFFAAHPDIVRIGFNGRKAAGLFKRFAANAVDSMQMEQVVLPSTSPAYASMPVSEKLRRWREFMLR